MITKKDVTTLPSVLCSVVSYKLFYSIYQGKGMYRRWLCKRKDCKGYSKINEIGQMSLLLWKGWKNGRRN